jgi:acid phosphatase class B
MLEATAKAVKLKADQTWTLTKKTIGLLSMWGLVFSLVTIGQLRVGFDYDDTLVYSTPAFQKAFKAGVQPFSPRFWEVVNNSYELERIKPLPYALAWIFRIAGFKVTVITARPAYGGDSLKKEWRFVSTDFVFAGGSANKHKTLRQGNYVLFFGDSDSDITQGRKARVLTLRVKRSPKSSYKEDYHPGALREIVLPFTEF